MASFQEGLRPQHCSALAGRACLKLQCIFSGAGALETLIAADIATAMARLQALLLACTLLLWLPLLLGAFWLLLLLQAVVLAEALAASYLLAPLTGKGSK